MIDQIFGYDVEMTPALGLEASYGEHARRIVRHGMKDVLRWLGEDPGPEPWTVCHAALDPANHRLFVSPRLYDSIIRSVIPKGPPDGDRQEYMPHPYGMHTLSFIQRQRARAAYEMKAVAGWASPLEVRSWA